MVGECFLVDLRCLEIELDLGARVVSECLVMVRATAPGGSVWVKAGEELAASGGRRGRARVEDTCTGRGWLYWVCLFFCCCFPFVGKSYEGASLVFLRIRTRSCM